ncbi:SIMPL domain-containing protein [Patescibacteria group bacterium]|nr:SIMPL domain-containing protein [Patescibacteria group bacterium]
MKNNNFVNTLAAIIVFFAVGLGAIYMFPWHSMDWGKLSMVQDNLIVVSGTSKEQKRNEIAKFTAGASAVNTDRDTAVNEVNGIVTKITEAVKTFGIRDEDIKTSNLSIYQEEESYYEDGVQKRRKGQWRVSNNIEVVLRNVDDASQLADILTKNGATNVYGPMLTLDDTQKAGDELLTSAIEDAKEKAMIMAEAAGGSLGEVVSVVEGSSPTSVYRAMGEMGGGGGVPIEPGSSMVSKTVVVSFRLK